MGDLPLDQVRTLLAVVEEGTFDAAAAALNVTPSAVSQRVKALEQRTGRVLLLRTKPVRPTESGTQVVRFARQLAQLDRDLRAGLGEPGESVRLPIAVNADSLATWFLPALGRVPDVCFELHREDESHTAALLREGLVMAAVTSSPEPVPGCSVRPLGLMRYLPVAAPGFAARWLDGPLRQRIGAAPVVVFDRRDELQDHFARGLTKAPASAQRHHVPSSEAYLEAIVAGLGWGLAPTSQARARLAAGELVSLGQRWVDVPLFWQQWALESPALSATARAVFDAAKDGLVRPGRAARSGRG
ncbi:LysR family transcriptional regulator ArgP [Actinokineospora diospyrosa]|uniref:LysR family transcriptional regulator, chromosome initiation inhibitor n=1 Tax=Actinokineospora diospyrosa TaxID=103728 RepID=A0ABT1INF8_9PSEU|nr:LysR family transcriptional regulator ArgP [Actinokineospora diospyrosa]MCP2274207.1 LysR family transcriptional regulator, chromosome initiation inhibitor [Actinokineospora diospyrosa]